MIFADAAAFDDAIRFVLAAKAAGIPIAAASSSKNADLLLRPACRRPRPAGWPLSAWPAWATPEALVNAGADLAVRGLDEVSRPALAEDRLEGKTLKRRVEA
jgi:beta-phosphoglucomutase